MDIEVKQHDVDVPRSLVDNIHRCMAADLRRFDHMIRRICVHIADVNGPRGGEDKSCRIHVQLKRASSVIVGDRGANLLVVVARAVARVEVAVSRAADRMRGRRRGRARGIARQTCTA
jgi:putative sigma-54 modulation protein